MRPPASVGQPLAQVDTPALILELDAFERNLKTVADLARGRVRVRAHAKNVCLRGGVVEALWPITARGALA